MHGLVSLLDPEHYFQVEEIWNELEGGCGLTGIKVTPYPHFSWLIAEEFDWDLAETTLAKIAANTRPLTARTTGLSLFTGPMPVAYIPLVRTAELSEFHHQLWEQFQSAGWGISPHYAPEYWMPHITLAHTDLMPHALDCLMSKLAHRTFNWEIKVDNLALLLGPQRHSGRLKRRFDFDLA
ncbi:MAG: 2'-5' RNA ligase family protein [Chloroflexota bacterium]